VHQEQVPHAMPSLICRDEDDEPFMCAALLKDIQATCLSCMIPIVQEGPDVKVFMPYRPVGRHGYALVYTDKKSSTHVAR
jgi:hypothetical protein